MRNQDLDYADIDVTDPSLPDPFRSSRLTLDGKSANTDLESSQVVTFVTGNAKKLEEVQAILSAQCKQKASADCASSDSTPYSMPYKIKNMSIDLPELQGDPVEIAIEKCRLAALEVATFFAT